MPGRPEPHPMWGICIIALLCALVACAVADIYSSISETGRLMEDIKRLNAEWDQVDKERRGLDEAKERLRRANEELGRQIEATQAAIDREKAKQRKMRKEPQDVR